jgi:hypothetical protein
MDVIWGARTVRRAADDVKHPACPAALATLTSSARKGGKASAETTGSSPGLGPGSVWCDLSRWGVAHAAKTKRAPEIRARVRST